jgi:hypothetical protein
MQRLIAAILITLGLLTGLSTGAAYADNNDCPETPWSVYSETDISGGACSASGLNSGTSIYNCTTPGAPVLLCDDYEASDGSERIRTCTKTCLGDGGGDTGGGGDPGGDPGGGGLTQEQLEALAAVLAALQNAQGYADSATGNLASLTALYQNLGGLQTALADYRGRVSGAVATIGRALSPGLPDTCSKGRHSAPRPWS